MTIIILFYISLLGMIYMIFLKSGEMNSGRRNILSRLGSGADHIFQSAFQSVGQGISYINKHTFIALAHWLAYHVLVRVRNVYVEIKHYVLANPHGKRLIDAVRGRGEIRNHSASFYLRRIGKRNME
ncbi:MAG: hypothetical protein A3B11_02325 [Candidatus Taylorbacteria bacterium RIFCSPLOWO2_01_FULL_44_26]|uniref:Uncharacterized protein n=2 Tax=Candidatus Tayloriibacteriota TaxID=1817919 RepID=A0A1G2MMR7_9BACT|nr:MAG: hypothetical protein A3D50_01365 [Candidatus Taylorbacteria bacterium RIFCSPHIGHO2_02_FULL_44_12]OHA30799.1 MAG: hypothetical protein A3B11_02325 [Candidatus Taylorbacteria bacterium RIFCSPLOWO2_01_FULL_44_26]